MVTEQQGSQIAKLAGSLVEHQGAFAALSTPDRQWIVGHTKKAISIMCEAVRTRNTPIHQRALEFAGSTSSPPYAHFSGRMLTDGDLTGSGVEIGRVTKKFIRNLGTVVERNIPETRFNYYTSVTDAKKPAQKRESGHVAPFGTLWQLLIQEKAGNWVGINRTDRHYMFVQNEDEDLWSVIFYWQDGWCFDVEANNIVMGDKLPGRYFFATKAA